jgi:hypothetical protein
MPNADNDLIAQAAAVDAAMQSLHASVAVSANLLFSDDNHASAEAATTAASRRVTRLLENLTETAAVTLDGLKAKAAAALAVGDLFEDDVVELHRAIAHDLAAIALPAA